MNFEEKDLETLIPLSLGLSAYIEGVKHSINSLKSLLSTSE